MAEAERGRCVVCTPHTQNPPQCATESLGWMESPECAQAVPRIWNLASGVQHKIDSTLTPDRKTTRQQELNRPTGALRGYSPHGHVSRRHNLPETHPKPSSSPPHTSLSLANTHVFQIWTGDFRAPAAMTGRSSAQSCYNWVLLIFLNVFQPAGSPVDSRCSASPPRNKNTAAAAHAINVGFFQYCM